MRRILKIAGGFLLLGVGLVLSLPGVPGPGLVIAVIGLAMLSEHFHWARRMTNWGKRKLEQAKERAGVGRRKREAPAAKNTCGP